MPENKTKPTDISVSEFLDGVENVQRREDTLEIVEMMTQITGHVPQMWGASLIGFGKYQYQYRSGHKGEFPLVSVSPRARNVTVYIMPGFDQFESLMNRLGKYKTGKSCLYLNRLADVDRSVLSELITKSVEYMREKYDTD